MDESRRHRYSGEWQRTAIFPMRSPQPMAAAGREVAAATT